MSVLLRHRVTGALYEVPEAAVDIYGRSGWEPADPPLPEPLERGGELPPGPAEAGDAAGEPEPVITENQSPRGRRTKKEQD